MSEDKGQTDGNVSEAGGGLPSKPDPLPAYELSREQLGRAAEAFAAVLDDAVLAYEIGQLDLFAADEEELHVQREVERLLYNPELPAGGSRERRVIERIKELRRTAPRDWAGHHRAERMMELYEATLPANPRHGGRYYTRSKLKPSTSKDEWEWFTALEAAAARARQWEFKWFARLCLEGEPELVSDFEMECLFLLRMSDGSVNRLVRLHNVVGERSQGEHHKGSILLDEDSFCSPEKFRRWCLKYGNFDWSGNQKELHKLHLDIGRSNAWRVINRVDSVGWREVKKAVPSAECRMLNAGSSPSPLPSSPGEGGGARAMPQSITKSGIWFCDECAIADGQVLRPDEDGIYWWQGEGYYLNTRGRESSFIQGRPKMWPGLVLTKQDNDWQLTEPDTTKGGAQREARHLAEFYREVSAKLFDTFGGYEGWLAMGAMFAFAAGPEIFGRHGFFPGLFGHGQMGSGKTKSMELLMHLWGFERQSGIALLGKGTAVGLLQELENYSNLPLWADEFKAGQVDEGKEATLKDAYNRLSSPKWSPDGIQRKINTMFVVTGESTSSDPAMQSRYAHVLVSATKRLANHLEWLDRHKGKFFVFGRWLLMNREALVTRLHENLAEWMGGVSMGKMDDRQKLLHGIHWASFASVTSLIDEQAGSLTAENTVDSDPFSASASEKFARFLEEHAKGSAADVNAETNIATFLTDLVTAVKTGDFDKDSFVLLSDHAKHPPDRPNQLSGWRTYRLFMDPDLVMRELNVYLVQERRSIALKKKDLRDQLSRIRGWIPNARQRFNGLTRACWGFNLDEMEMGYQPCSDDAVNEWFVRQDDNSGDPRKGPFYEIVQWLEEKKRDHEQAIR